MTTVNPAEVQRVCCIGTGVIGTGWVIQFLSRGFDVTAWDPAPAAEDRLRHEIDRAWPIMTELGLAGGASPDRVTFAGSMAAALDGTQFVQESGPEGPKGLALKQDLLAEIDALLPPVVVIGSSVAEHRVTDIQAKATRPGRIVAGHPFNPPHLIPLVEVAGGERTDPEVVQWAADFYTYVGKYVVIMPVDVAGFIGNRLQGAISREAYRMWTSGEATLEQIDRTISEGPGLRWALFGNFMTEHLSQAGGIRGAIEHFGTRASDDPALEARLVSDIDSMTAGRSVADLAADRDRKLAEILKIKRQR